MNANASNLRREPLLVSVVLAACTAVVLSGCWNAPFYKVDDQSLVRRANEDVVTVFTPKVTQMYVPLTILSFKLDKMLFERPDGDWAAGVRVMNGVYHALAGVLLYFFLRALLNGNSRLALAIAALWTIHPMACESACWIVERKNVLAALFGFGALFLRMRIFQHGGHAEGTESTEGNGKGTRISGGPDDLSSGREAQEASPEALGGQRAGKAAWIVVYALFALSLLSKPSGLSFFPLLLLVEFFVRAKWTHAALRLAIPLVMTLGISRIATFVNQYDIVEPLGGSIFTVLLSDVEIFARYAGNLLMPRNLSFYYAVDPIRSLSDSRLWTNAAFLIAIFGGCIALTASDKRRASIFGAVWFFAALGPNSNLISTAYPMQDRFAYIAAPGLLLVVGLAVWSVIARMRVQFLAPAVAVAALIFAGCFTYFRSQVFSDGDRLELDAALRQPKSAYARICAATVWKGRFYKSIEAKSSPNETRQLAVNSAQELGAAYDCPDIEYFENKFALRVQMAELWTDIDVLDNAYELIREIPPPSVLPPDVDIRQRRNAFRYLAPGWVSEAYRVRAEILLRRSALVGLKPPDRWKLCELAIQDSQAAQNTPAAKKDKVSITRAHILARMSDLAAGQKDNARARACYEEAKQLLEKIPADSPSAALAKYSLSNLKAPE